MTYRGQVKNGVVVFDGVVPLKEGTDVCVVPVKKRPKKLPPGSPQRILNSKARWHGDPEELDRLLAELKEMKWAEVRAQQAKER